MCNFIFGRLSLESVTHKSLITRHTSHVTHHTSHVTRHTSHVARHTSHIARHTSRVTRHTSHITRHTSHVTHHTSHITRRTSHVTYHGTFSSPAIRAPSMTRVIISASFALCCRASSNLNSRTLIHVLQKGTEKQFKQKKNGGGEMRHFDLGVSRV